MSDKQTFSSGAVRDTQIGKDRLDMLPWPVLRRDARHYFKNSDEGGGKYPMHNWRLGIPSSRCLQSLLRHVAALCEQDTSEDHLAAIRFNAGCIMWNEDVLTGSEFDDLPDRTAMPHLNRDEPDQPGLFDPPPPQPEQEKVTHRHIPPRPSCSHHWYSFGQCWVDEDMFMDLTDPKRSPDMGLAMWNTSRRMWSVPFHSTWWTPGRLERAGLKEEVTL